MNVEYDLTIAVNEVNNSGWGQVDKTEREALLTWNRYINRFFTLFADADIGNAIEEGRAVAGLC